MKEKIKINSNKSFGLVFFVVFLIVSLYPLLNQESIRVWSIIISFIFTLFMFSFNPFVRNIGSPDNKLSKKIFIIGLLLTIGASVLTYFNSKNKSEEENKIFIEKVYYGLLLTNYIVFLIFNVFFRYSGLNILSKFNIKVS